MRYDTGANWDWMYFGVVNKNVAIDWCCRQGGGVCNISGYLALCEFLLDGHHPRLLRLLIARFYFFLTCVPISKVFAAKV